jgi:DNA-binding transcriptional MerR regulator
MNVSQIAREVGIAPSAIRFYERRGILPAAARGPNGYREYGNDDLCRLRVVVTLRQLGLELGVAGRLAELCASGHCDLMSRDLGPLIAAQRSATARARAELDALDRQLADLQAVLAEGDADPTECITEGGETDDQLRLRRELPVRAVLLTPGC